jgi:hypothetical protein
VTAIAPYQVYASEDGFLRIVNIVGETLHGTLIDEKGRFKGIFVSPLFGFEACVAQRIWLLLDFEAMAGRPASAVST